MTNKKLLYLVVVVAAIFSSILFISFFTDDNVEEKNNSHKTNSNSNVVYSYEKSTFEDNPLINNFEEIKIDGKTYYKASVKDGVDLNSIKGVKKTGEIKEVSTKLTGYTDDIYNNVCDSPQLYNNGINNLYSKGIDGKGITVVVIDSGVTKGYSDDVFSSYDLSRGYDFVNDRPMIENGVVSYSNENEEHGDKVSSVLAGKANNGIGSVGVAPGVKIIPIRFTKNGSGETEGLYKCLCYVEDLLKQGNDDIKVVNMSVAMVDEDSTDIQYYYDNYFFTTEINEKITEITEKYGVAVIAAAGNGIIKQTFDGLNIETKMNGDNYTFPACCDKAISVTACDEYNMLCNFSTYNDNVDLCAIGTLVSETNKPYGFGIGKRYNYDSGTSFSAPIVSGIFALMYSQDKNLETDKILKALKSTSTTLDIDYTNYRKDVYSVGVVNATLAYNKLFNKKIKIDTSYILNPEALDDAIAYPEGSVKYNSGNIFEAERTFLRIYGMNKRDIEKHYELTYVRNPEDPEEIVYELTTHGYPFTDNTSTFRVNSGLDPIINIKNLNKASATLCYNKDWQDKLKITVSTDKKFKSNVKEYNITSARTNGKLLLDKLKPGNKYYVKIQPYIIYVNYSIKTSDRNKYNKKIYYGSETKKSFTTIKSSGKQLSFKAA